MNAWQTIETAPRDGVDVLVFFPGADTPIMICHEIDGDWHEQNPSIGPPVDVEATHWQPLPAPPFPA